MKTKSYEGSETRKILSAMVTNSTVCARVASQWKSEGLFNSKWADLVGGWCVKHFNKYGEPPNGQLKVIFDKWADSSKSDESTVRMVSNFLEETSDEFDREKAQESTEFLLDRAGELFNKQRMQKAIEDAEYELGLSNTSKARDFLANGIEKVELGEGALIKPGEDYEIWREAFDKEETEQLIRYPGKANDFIGSVMVRDSLVSFMGPDKSGKSMYLLDAACRATRNKRRVAYFEAGDMSQNQVMMRLGQRVCRMPKYQGRVNIPTEFENGKIAWQSKSFEEGITPQRAFKEFKRFSKNKDLFRLSCYPNSTIDVTMINSIVSGWAREGWVADVVVVDYADILAPPPMARDPLDQIDTTWKMLRRTSQELHCLVLTATQASATAYTAKGLLGKRHFSGRKTKLAHVNGMIGINVSEYDKKKGISKLNWIVKRDGFYMENQYVTMVGSLEICNPCIVSG